MLRRYQSNTVVGVRLTASYAILNFQASGQGLVDVVERLIEENPERLTSVDIKGWTCLHHAAARSRIKVIDMLLSKGASKRNLHIINVEVSLFYST